MTSLGDELLVKKIIGQDGRMTLQGSVSTTNNLLPSYAYLGGYALFTSMGDISSGTAVLKYKIGDDRYSQWILQNTSGGPQPFTLQFDDADEKVEAEFTVINPTGQTATMTITGTNGDGTPYTPTLLSAVQSPPLSSNIEVPVPPVEEEPPIKEPEFPEEPIEEPIKEPIKIPEEPIEPPPEEEVVKTMMERMMVGTFSGNVATFPYTIPAQTTVVFYVSLNTWRVKMKVSNAP